MFIDVWHSSNKVAYTLQRIIVSFGMARGQYIRKELKNLYLKSSMYKVDGSFFPTNSLLLQYIKHKYEMLSYSKLILQPFSS